MMPRTLLSFTIKRYREMKSDITYCSDAEFCPRKHECLRADVPTEGINSYCRFYESKLLDIKDADCQHFRRKIPQEVITKS